MQSKHSTNQFKTDGKDCSHSKTETVNQITKTLDALIEEAQETAPAPVMVSMFPSSEAMREHLSKRGFPQRHIMNIDKMTGPGLKKAKELEERATGADCMLILCGDRGPGKTQMATYWASKIRNTRYFRAHDLMRAIRGEFSNDKQDAQQAKQTLYDAKTCAFLVLDEYSELAGSEYDKRTLTNLLDHRYGEQKSTIIITNTAIKDAPEEVGRSAWSRFEETGGIVHCNWESYRVG